MPELENVVGFFVNALPLRLRVEPEWSFLDCLRQVRAEVLEAFGHQDVPFEHLVRILNLSRDESRFPLYQAFFSYQDARQRPGTWGNLEHTNLPVFQPSAAQDLALWFLEDRHGLVGGMNYNTDIITATTAELLGARFRGLLNEIVGRADVPVRSLWRPARDEEGRLKHWNDTAKPLPSAGTISEFLSSAMVAAGDKVAVRQGEQTVTYSQLRAQAARIAAALAARGIGAGDVVGLQLARTPTMIATLLGVLESDATFLPLDPEFPAERLRFMLEDSGARIIVCDADSVQDSLAPERRLLVSELEESCGGTPVPAGSRATWAAAPAAERPAYLIYTSGSTGRSKGVLVPHRAVTNFLASMLETPGLAAGARLAAVTTLSFDIALLELLLPLAAGADIVLASREQARDGHALRRLLEQQQVDTMQATPSTWRLLIEAGWRGHSGFKALCGGEPLTAELADELLQRTGQLWNMYGPTETTVWSACGRIEAGQGDISIGGPIANTEVWVLDERGELAPIGVIGEICIGGAGVALGYHARPELTAERFVPDRLSGRSGDSLIYRTGDLGRWRSDGRLQCLGRTDFQVKIRGHRIELGEIEAVLVRQPEIQQAVVIATADADGRLDAYVVARTGHAPAVNDLRARLAAELPAYMIPSRFNFLPRLPLTPNGKVDRGALANQLAPDKAPAPLVAGTPRTEHEKQMADLWRELLRVEQVSIYDNFLDLGGHSLLIMRAVARIETQVGVRLSPRVFIFQTLEQIAAELARADPAAVRSEAPAQSAPPRKGIVHNVFRVLRRMLG
jgi:amino acid adenylation domain-containing protein